LAGFAIQEKVIYRMFRNWVGWRAEYHLTYISWIPFYLHCHGYSSTFCNRSSRLCMLDSRRCTLFRSISPFSCILLSSDFIAPSRSLRDDRLRACCASNYVIEEADDVSGGVRVSMKISIMLTCSIPLWKSDAAACKLDSVLSLARI
jgi:hypothetical protein